MPTLAFALAWARTENLRTALVVAGVCVAVLLVVRLVQRQDPRFIAYAAAGVGISAFFALRSGRAEDAFLPGMLQNAGLLVLLLVTNLTRWPLFGFVVGVAEPEAFAESPTWWRRHSGIVTVAARLAWVLIALNVVRLAIMVPLYLAAPTWSPRSSRTPAASPAPGSRAVTTSPGSWSAASTRTRWRPSRAAPTRAA